MPSGVEIRKHVVTRYSQPMLVNQLEYLYENLDRLDQRPALLPDSQREGIEVCYREKSSQRETAEAFDIPLETVKTRTLLAIRELPKSSADEIRQLMWGGPTFPSSSGSQ